MQNEGEQKQGCLHVNTQPEVMWCNGASDGDTGSFSVCSQREEREEGKAEIHRPIVMSGASSALQHSQPLRHGGMLHHERSPQRATPQHIEAFKN